MNVPGEFKDPEAIERRGDGERAEKLIDFANILGWRVHSYDLRNTAAGTGTIFTVAFYREGTDGETIDATPSPVTQDEPEPPTESSDPCLHVPAIMHRSGGASARLSNTCVNCGRFIKRAAVGDAWEIDADREAEASESR